VTEPPDHEQLQRAFARQVPTFDVTTALPGRVANLVRRRQRRRRAVVVAAAAVVVAAVAVPLSVLRSQPSGHGITPVTTPSTTPSTTPPTVPAGKPVACQGLDLANTATGTPVTVTVSSGDVTASLSGTARQTPLETGALTGAVLTVTVEKSLSRGALPLRRTMTVAPPAAPDTSPPPDGEILPSSLVPASTPTAPSTGGLCLGRFPGARLPTVLLGFTTGFAHCCTVVRAVAVTDSGLAPAVDDDLGNVGGLVEADGTEAMVVTADNAFAYQFGSFAGSGFPLKLLQFAGGRFVDITRQRPDLIAADATKWWTAFTTSADTAQQGYGGVLAPWVADECELGHEASAWATVNQLLQQGRLGPPSPWPDGAALVSQMKTFLKAHGYCP